MKDSRPGDKSSSRFASRQSAGVELQPLLINLLNDPNLVVLGLARGGMPVAFEVAQFLKAPLSVLVVRKIGAPQQPELGVGAISEDFEPYLDKAMIKNLGIPGPALELICAEETKLLIERSEAYHKRFPIPNLKDKTVILVDDGVARGVTLLTAIQFARSRMPKQILVAVPVIAAQTLPVLKSVAHQVFALELPNDLTSVGLWYEDFGQVSDAEVLELLESSHIVPN